MPNRVLFALALLVIACGALVIDSACGSRAKAPGGPVAPSVADLGPPPPPQSPLLRLEITGVKSVPPGETAQLAAVARYADGSSVDVTTASSWTSWNTTVMTVSTGGGLVRALTNGATAVQARFQSVSSTRDIFVLPAGTFRLMGQITEADAPTAPVENARLEVLTGPTAGLFTTTSFYGSYSLFGVPGDTELRVTRPGYVTRTEHVQLADHGTLNLQLAVVHPRSDLSGTYTLTIAVETCTGQPPLDESLRRRAYGAVVTQTGSQLRVKLNNGDQFRGNIDPATSNVHFVLEDYSFYYAPALSELLPDGSILVIVGSGNTTPSPTGLSGTFPGSLKQYDAPFPRSYTVLGSCNPATLRFTLSR